jgi:hypothetical protein
MNGKNFLALLVTTAMLGGCNSGSSRSDSGVSALHAPPAGCQMTLCDLVRSSCATAPAPNPCTSCFNLCLQDPEDTSCPGECEDVCSESTGAPPPNPCDTALDACRNTLENTICVDNLTVPGPNGEPCNDEASEAVCACTYDAACFSAISAAAPACNTCSNAALAMQCASVCTDQMNAYWECAQQNCAAGVACDFENSPCFGAAKAANDCFNAVLADPNDTTGCRAAEEACWTLPVCTDSLGAER